MTEHLTRDELLDAVDARLDPVRLEHAAACAECRQGVLDLQTIVHRLDGSVPEPSPLFWDHLSQRIRRATSDEPLPTASWWHTGWRPLAGLGAMAAVAALAVAIRTAPVHDTSRVAAPVVSDAASVTATDDAAWITMGQMAARLSSDDVHALVAAASELTPTVSELSAEERQAFVQLLGSELNGDAQ